MDILSAVANLLPAVGAVIGGPVGLAAGLAPKILNLLFSTSGSSDPIEAAKQIVADPNKLAEFNMRIRELENEELRLRLADVQSARRMSLELAKQGSLIAWVPALLSLTFVGGYFLFCGGMLYVTFFTGIEGDLTDRQVQIMRELLLAASPFLGLVTQYWFGSSRSGETNFQQFKTMIGGTK